MDNYRFYIPDLLQQAASAAAMPVRLPEDQAHHARTVLRLAGGETVTVFDGQGAWATGLVVIPSKREVNVKLQGGIQVDAAPKLRLTLATAVPKGDRAEWLVEQASQLNVAKILWLECDRGVVKPGDGKIEKWRRLAAESAKQCARTWIMQIGESARLEKVLAHAQSNNAKTLWLEPREGGVPVAAAIPAHEGDILALIGPEGGWSEREFTLLQSAANRNELTRIRLTPTILRIETACAAIAAIIMST